MMVYLIMLLLAAFVLVQGGCWDVNLQHTGCNYAIPGWQFTQAGYTCVGNFCAGIDPDKTTTFCADLRPEGWIVDQRTGKCKDPNAPDPCSYGEFVSSSNNNKCESCPKGQYQDSPFHTSTSCKDQYDLICQEGEKYIAENGGSRRPSPCEQCSAGQYQDSGYHQDSVCKQQLTCRQGETLQGGNNADAKGRCVGAPTPPPPPPLMHCSAGAYLDTGNNACPDCDAGKYQDSVKHQSTSCKWQETKDCDPGEKYITPMRGSRRPRPCEQCTGGKYQDSTNHKDTLCKEQTKNCNQGASLKGDGSITEQATCEAAPMLPPPPPPPIATSTAAADSNNVPARIPTTTPPTKAKPDNGDGSSTVDDESKDGNGSAGAGSTNGNGGSTNGGNNDDQTNDGATNGGVTNGDSNNNNNNNSPIAGGAQLNDDLSPNNNSSSAANNNPADDDVEPSKSNAGVTVIIILLVIVAILLAMVLVYRKNSKDASRALEDGHHQHQHPREMGAALRSLTMNQLESKELQANLNGGDDGYLRIEGAGTSMQQPYASDFLEDYAEIEDTRGDSNNIASGAGAGTTSDQTIQRCQYRQPGPGGQRCRTRTATVWCDKHACGTPSCQNSKASRVQVCEACSTHYPGVQGGAVAGTVYDVGGGNAVATGDVVMVAVSVDDDDGGGQPQQQRIGLNQQGSVYLGFDDNNEESML